MKFNLPLKIKQSKKKMFSMNLNQYRNLHYRTLNTLKRRYTEWFIANYKHSGKPIEKCCLHYTIYFPDRRKTDLGNVCSVIDKFTADCLSKTGWIKDDNREIVKRIIFEDGGIDKDNPRCELEIKPLN